MKRFLDDNFLLNSTSAEQLYHDYAKSLPIIDYHCHLPPEQIANDINFENLTRVWLNGDHYKWRAMRTNGVREEFITGNASDRDKFEKWAETVPATLRNPLYHWTHLELQRYFGVRSLLNKTSAADIYDNCNAQLQQENFSVKNLLRKMKVKVVCTTDDPTDDLASHDQLKSDGFEIPVYPAFRPDKAMQVGNPETFNSYVGKLEKAANRSVTSFADYLDTLKNRHDFFASKGCTVSDHGLDFIDAEEYTDAEIEHIFSAIRNGKQPDPTQVAKFRSAMLYIFAIWDCEKGWVQQYHLGAFRSANSRMLRTMGPDTGWDSVGDFQQGASLRRFLDRLDNTNQLAKTILYNLNPRDNELMATMAGNYNDGSVAGKVQFGAAWWFLDQKDGMTKQMNSLSNMGLLSRFVGMLTDSRSFLSFPRHEYFRRLLCDLLGEEIERGELPPDMQLIGKMVSDICYDNAKNYFNW